MKDNVGHCGFVVGLREGTGLCVEVDKGWTSWHYGQLEWWHDSKRAGDEILRRGGEQVILSFEDSCKVGVHRVGILNE